MRILICILIVVWWLFLGLVLSESVDKYVQKLNAINRMLWLFAWPVMLYIEGKKI